MANIDTYLENIMQARYGRDVRQSIHDGIEAINDDTIARNAENKAIAENAVDLATQAKGEAKTAQDSAQAYANQALAHEQQAQIYRNQAEQFKDEAFSGTPEGYADLVAKVNSIYRQTAASYNVVGTSEGSALAHTIYGMSVQDGTPTPTSPVEIQSAKADFKCRGKNLINATLTSHTVNGLTVTKNQDGTYMISGTATDNVLLFLENVKSVAESGLTNGSDYRLCGCPSGGSLNTYFVVLYSYDENHNVISSYADIGSGTTRTLANSAVTIRPAISIKTGTTLNNVLFKPMLTIDLTATYDDYEPYKATEVTTDLTLRALEVTSSDDYNLEKDGKYYVADTIDWSEDEGYKITRRVKQAVIDGSNVKAIYYQQTTLNGVVVKQINLTDTANDVIKKIGAYVLSNILESVTYSARKVNSILVANNDGIIASYYDTDMPFSSITTFNTWAQNNPFIINYILATPTTEPITSEQAQALLSLKTYDEATSISATGDIEPSLDLEYSKDRNTALALTGHNLAHKNALKLNDINTALIELGGN